jgi:glutamate-ammonia-ligase adenylyltransferase
MSFDLKQSPGGMVDIEFLVQYLVLLRSSEFAELVEWTDNVRLLDALKKTGVLDGQTADFLKGAYLSLRSTAHRLSLQNKPAVIVEGTFDDIREKTMEIWNRFIPGTNRS